MSVPAARIPVKFRSLLPALLVLAVSLIATALSVYGQRAVLISSERARFAVEGDVIADNVSDLMTAYISVMKAGVALLNAKGAANPEEWQRFIAALDLDTDFPGITGVGFAEVLQKSVADGGTLAGESGAMTTSIRFLAPDDARNQRAIGYDMYSEAVRREAMARARDSGVPAMSAAVTLLQQAGEKRQAGVLMYLPVYASGTLQPDVAARRRDLIGFVYSAFLMDNLMSVSLAKRNPEMLRQTRLRLSDGTDTANARLLFDSYSLLRDGDRAVQENLPPPLFNDQRLVSIAGRTWQVNIASRPEFERKIDWSRLGVQLAGGIIISILMAAIAAGLALAKVRSQQAAMRLSDEVDVRKTAQEQAQLANRELIHRVKNTLAIVNAIASQTARHTRTMPEFMRAFRERLSALGRVHDLLRPDRAGNPDLRNLLVDTLSPYKPEEPTGLVLEGPDVPVARDDAVLLSLFINEMATNAIKYGAWSRSRGRVNVRWRLDDSPGKQEHLVLVWKEEHGPKVSPPERTGFGTNVMRFAIERSLGGTVKLGYPETGVEHEIRLPWGNAVDPTAPFGQIPNKAM